jgi:hypothetical protein
MRRRTWAYMVMAGLAWSLKAWAALLLPEHPRWAERHRGEGCNRTHARDYAAFLGHLFPEPS